MLKHGRDRLPLGAAGMGMRPTKKPVANACSDKK